LTARRGRPVLGFFGGILFGIGLVVVLQQAGLWPFNPITTWGIPAVLAIIGILLGRTAAFAGGR
jgi:hypothetical protein